MIVLFRSHIVEVASLKISSYFQFLIKWQVPALGLFPNIISFVFKIDFNPLSANPTKWSNTLKQFVGKLPTDF